MEKKYCWLKLIWSYGGQMKAERHGLALWGKVGRGTAKFFTLLLLLYRILSKPAGL